MKQIPPEHNAGLILSAALAFLGGYTDAATYIASTVFAGHISGNCVLLAISVVTLKWHDAAIRAAAVVFIVIGIAVSSLLDMPSVRASGIPPLTLGLAVESLLFFVPGIATLSRHPIPTVWSVLLLCIALGIQTGALRRTNGVSVYTAFMAGMVARLAERETARLEDPDSSADNNARTLTTLFTTFMLGALAGAQAAVHLPRWTFFVMALLLVVLAALHTTRAQRMRDAHRHA